MEQARDNPLFPTLDETRTLLDEGGGNLNFQGQPLRALPDGLTEVPGDLLLARTDVCALPSGLTHIGGDLDLELAAQLISLPDNLRIAGDLCLYLTPISALPSGLSVGGNIDLRGVPSLLPSQSAGQFRRRWEARTLTLPENLTVGGNLDLNHSGVSQLPHGLHVGGDLDLRHTGVTTLPDDLQVGGNLLASCSQITVLPEGLWIPGFLDLFNTKLECLPQRLTVGGIDIRRTPVEQRKEQPCTFTLLDLPQISFYYEEPGTYILRCRVGACRVYFCMENGWYLLSDPVGFDVFRHVRRDIMEGALSCLTSGRHLPDFFSPDMKIHCGEGLALFHLVTGIRLDRVPSLFTEGVSQPKTGGTVPLRSLIKTVAGHPGGEQFAAFFERNHVPIDGV